MMLTTTEARAHLTIVETLDLVLADKMGSRTATHIMWRPLESFAPRCNCRRVLMFGPVVDGTRIVACACGASHFESNIWHKVELGGHARR